MLFEFDKSNRRPTSGCKVMLFEVVITIIRIAVAEPRRFMIGTA